MKSFVIWDLYIAMFHLTYFMSHDSCRLVDTKGLLDITVNMLNMTLKAYVCSVMCDIHKTVKSVHLMSLKSSYEAFQDIVYIRMPHRYPFLGRTRFNIADNIASNIAKKSEMLLTILLNQHFADNVASNVADQQCCQQYCLKIINLADNIGSNNSESTILLALLSAILMAILSNIQQYCW